jgi:hypothetical protein
MEIAKAKEGEVQQALAKAYEEKAIPGNQVLAIRQIIEQRNASGKGCTSGASAARATTGRVTSEALIRAYQRETDRQRQLVKRASLTQSRLMFVTNALRRLLADDHFVTLMRAEASARCPARWPSASATIGAERWDEVKIAFEKQDRDLVAQRHPAVEMLPPAVKDLGQVPPHRRSRSRSWAWSNRSSSHARKRRALSAAGRPRALQRHARSGFEPEARCLIAADDEGFTYNKRVNRLATIQEHYMIVRALERGVSEEKLARALNVDVGVIRQRRHLLNGISADVAELLKDKPVGMHTFRSCGR